MVLLFELRAVRFVSRLARRRTKRNRDYSRSMQHRHMEVLQRFCCKSQLFLDFVNKIYLPCCCVVFFVVCPLHGPISCDFCELSLCVGIHYQTTRRRSVNFSNFTIHLSVKFGWADRPPVKKLTSVFYASVLLFIVNFVISGIKVAVIIHELGDRQVDPRTTLTIYFQ